MAFPCGGGNGGGYTIFDYDAGDLTLSHGEWNTGAYPRAAAWSQDGARFLGSDGDRLMVFTADTHVLVREAATQRCSYGDVRAVGFSRGGRIVYGLSLCGFDDDSGRLFWEVLP